MNNHSIRVTAQCAFEGPNGRCRRMTTTTHPYCGPHTKSELGLLVAKSRIAKAGLGLFAARPFRKDGLVVEYTGEKLTTKAYNEKYGDDAMGAYGITLNARYVLDAAKTSSSVARYACDYHGSGKKPNAEFVTDRGRIWIVALRDLRVGDEIYVDYGEDMHRAMGLL